MFNLPKTNKMARTSVHSGLITFFAMLLLSGCGGVKYADMLMFEQVAPSVTSQDSVPVLMIQPDDILNIKVVSQNMETLTAFQMQREGTAGVSSAALGMPEGYRVDELGFIHLPFLGSVSAAGKTIKDLRSEIATRILDYFPDATVQVRFVNFRVTLMGEVRAPNTYIIPNERLTILEAIGMAGDFSDYARRSNVLVIRERNEVREFARVDTQHPELFKSPYFYLSPNDIIYVEPLKAKQYATRGHFVDRYGIILVPVFSAFSFWLFNVLAR